MERAAIVDASHCSEAHEIRHDSQSSHVSGDDDVRILLAAFADLVKEGSQIENLAMELDRAGDSEQAIACYKQAADRLSQAAVACPDGNSDRAVLSRHAGQIFGRVVYLQSLGAAPAMAPVEAHIDRVHFTLGGGPRGADVAVSWKQRAASAAAVTGAAGLLVLHAPMAAAVLAAGAAYATTREDGAGQAARTVGDLGLQAAEHARALSDEKRIPERVENALCKVRSINEQYGVTSKAQAATESSWQALRELDRKHQVTEKVGSGLITASAGVAFASARAAGWVARIATSRQ